MTPDTIIKRMERRLKSLAKGMTKGEAVEALKLKPVAPGAPEQWSSKTKGWRERISIDGKEIEYTLRSPDSSDAPDAKANVAAASKAWRVTLTGRCGTSKKIDSVFVRFKLPDGRLLTTGKFDTAGEDGRAYVIKNIIRL